MKVLLGEEEANDYLSGIEEDDIKENLIIEDDEIHEKKRRSRQNFKSYEK